MSKKTKISGIQKTARLSNVGFREDGRLQFSANYQLIVGEPDRPLSTVVLPSLEILLQDVMYKNPENFPDDLKAFEDRIMNLLKDLKANADSVPNH